MAPLGPIPGWRRVRKYPTNNLDEGQREAGKHLKKGSSSRPRDFLSKDGGRAEIKPGRPNRRWLSLRPWDGGQGRAMAGAASLSKSLAPLAGLALGQGVFDQACGTKFHSQPRKTQQAF